MSELNNDLDRVDIVRQQVNCAVGDKKLLHMPYSYDSQPNIIQIPFNIVSFVAVDRTEIRCMCDKALESLLRRRLISALRDAQDMAEATLERL